MKFQDWTFDLFKRDKYRHKLTSSVQVALFLLLLLKISPLQANNSSKKFPWRPSGSCDLELQKKTFTLCYDQNHRISRWAFHVLNQDLLKGSTKRTNDYRRDPQVKTNAVEGSDYAGSGFDRGHLVPAADMKKNRTIMSETFFMTNMTPQRPDFNRGIWRALENLVRRQVAKRGEAIVITVSLVKEGDSKLPKGITIPSAFAKVLYWPSKKEMMAFRIPNQGANGLGAADFQVSVNTIEKESKIDFFSEIDDQIEETLEDTIIDL